jgi:hypothetical protein
MNFLAGSCPHTLRAPALRPVRIHRFLSEPGVAGSSAVRLSLQVVTIPNTNDAMPLLSISRVLLYDYIFLRFEYMRLHLQSCAAKFVVLGVSCAQN